MGMKTWLSSRSSLQRELLQLQQTVMNWELFWSRQNDATTDAATGNPYSTYDTAIAELSKKYEGIADWGCDQARTIVDTRAAFTIGNGIQITEIDPKTGKAMLVASGKFTKEQDFVRQFIQNNNLDEENAQEFAKEAEIEGRILFKLIPNQEKKSIDLRFLSYNTNHYKVISNSNDYLTYERVEYKTNSTEVVLKQPEFVYKKFAGRTDKVNDVMPRTATILRKLEALDKALKDLRDINNLFASPTPWFDCEDSNDARDLATKLAKINWKPGKFLTTTKTKFSMVGADVAGAESLVKEIVSICKVISGVTGIPVHFLGLPDLMSNRAVSTDMFEMIVASTNRERKTWIGTYEELFKKAMLMSNEVFGTTFNPDSVSCDIPQVTAEKLRELVDVWLPLLRENVIDLDYILGKIPDADVERIKASAEAEAQKQLDILKAQEAANANQGGFGA